MLSRDELLKLHASLTANARSTMAKKNQDYATDQDVFRNFRMFGGLGILVRMSDKLSRLRSYEERGTFSVEDEGLKDTIEDLINYAVIYYAFHKEQQPETGVKFNYQQLADQIRELTDQDGFCTELIG